jgi:hypothetical protein
MNSTAQGPNCPLCPRERVGAQCGARELSCHNDDGRALVAHGTAVRPGAGISGGAPPVCYGSPATRANAPHGA